MLARRLKEWLSREAVVVPVREIRITGAATGAVRPVPTEQGAAPMREPVSRAVATALRRIASVHPAICAPGAASAYCAGWDAVILINRTPEVAARIAVAASDVAAGHEQSSKES